MRERRFGRWPATTSAVAIALVAVLLLLSAPSMARAASFTVDSTADAVDAKPGDGVCDDGAGNCTLRAAIMETNALPGADTITLPAGTYTLSIAGAGEDAAATGDLDITDTLTINGAGAATTIIDGDALDRVFQILPGTTVEMAGMTVRYGNASTGGGGIFNRGSLIVTSSNISDNTADHAGGGIYNTVDGTLTLTNSTVSGNTADDGGGIYNVGGASLTLTNSNVSDNLAIQFGGGIHNVGGPVTLTSSTVSGNSAGNWDGGGIFNGGPLTLTNSTVRDNTAGFSGGGISNFGSPLTLTNSAVSGNTADNVGGGIYNSGTTLTIGNGSVIRANDAGSDGGGIWNNGELILTSSTVSDNSADDGGGGIFNLGALTLVDSAVTNNTAAGDGGGIFNQAGALSISGSAVTGNTAGDDGGGISNIILFDGSQSIIASEVSGNTAADQGGGIYNVGGSSESVLALTDVTVTDNTATGAGFFDPSEGGGIYNASNGALTIVRSAVTGNMANDGGGIFQLSVGKLTIVDSAVTSNTASGTGLDFGGGIHVAISGSVLVLIQNSTISGNAADSGGGIFFQSTGTLRLISSTVSVNVGQGIRRAFSGAVTLERTIVANSASGDDCSGSMTSLGHNIDSDGTCGLTDPLDLPSTNPVLGPLQNNGGPTETHALLAGSPAINAVPVADCKDAGGNSLTTDQRGVARPQGAACDIGAFELQVVLDLDGDGIPDSEDACPNSDLSATVVIDGDDSGVGNLLLEDGCTISDLIAAAASEAGNHGEFVAAVAGLVRGLRSDGVITGSEAGAMMRAAASAAVP